MSSPAPPPAEWYRFKAAFRSAAAPLAERSREGRRERQCMGEQLERLRAELAAPRPALAVPEGLHPDLAGPLEGALRTVREQRALLLASLERHAKDFEHAADNEERFVVLVFGEVNAGKSALANHMAGLDFDAMGDHPRGDCFLEDAVHPDGRLAELPVECTRDYQGFRMPGLLWIDCPGVLSGNAANAALAQRLVARADIVLFVSSSDAPFKQSEMRELAAMIQASGQDCLETCTVITKADLVDEDEDPETGTLSRRVVAKELPAIGQQRDWYREQVQASELDLLVRTSEPFAVSVYIARDALGRCWESGARVGPTPADWLVRYRASGMPQLMTSLAALVEREGPSLKAAWPHKRRKALAYLLQREAALTRQHLDPLLRTVRERREALRAAREPTCRHAAELAAASASRCLRRHGVYGAGRFDREAALAELHRELRAATLHAVAEGTQDVFARLDDALARDCVATDLALPVHARRRQHAYRTSAFAQGVGKTLMGMLGGAGGAWAGMGAGATLGTAVAPGFGTVVGGVLGGVLGGVAGGTLGGRTGRFVGQLVKQELRIDVPAGTNGNEVILKTQAEMRARATFAVGAMFDEIERMLFAPVERELAELSADLETQHRVFDPSLRRP